MSERKSPWAGNVRPATHSGARPHPTGSPANTWWMGLGSRTWRTVNRRPGPSKFVRGKSRRCALGLRGGREETGPFQVDELNCRDSIFRRNYENEALPPKLDRVAGATKHGASRSFVQASQPGKEFHSEQAVKNPRSQRGLNKSVAIERRRASEVGPALRAGLDAAPGLLWQAKVIREPRPVAENRPTHRASADYAEASLGRLRRRRRRVNFAASEPTQTNRPGFMVSD